MDKNRFTDIDCLISVDSELTCLTILRANKKTVRGPG